MALKISSSAVNGGHAGICHWSSPKLGPLEPLPYAVQ